MNYARRQALAIAVGLVLVAGGTWWWFANMEKRWSAREKISDAVLENPMYAAARLLERHRHGVTVAGTLAEALRGTIPDGTVILADNGGLVTHEQATRLLEWVSRGNTLIVRPKWSGRTSYYGCGDEGSGVAPKRLQHDDPESDPFGAEYGVELAQMLRHRDAPDEKSEPRKKAPWPPCLAHLALPQGVPGSGHELLLDIDHFALKSFGNSGKPRFGDDIFDAVRAYGRGTGHVVFVAQNYFDNLQLAWYDHAELLLGLTELSRARHVLIVQHLEMPKWYEALWWQFKYGIIGSACLLSLLLWLAVRRFGPLLPEPDPERRSLLEHVDASGRWLWKIPGGRELLLAAARGSVERLLLRKLPSLQRLSPAERVRHLAQLYRLAPDDVAAALIEPASKSPLAFTRQIQMLAELRLALLRPSPQRNHHER